MKRDEFVRIGIALNDGKEWGWQTRMAEALRVDGSTVRRWVSGAVPIPGPVEAALLCFMSRLKESDRRS